MKIKQIFSGLLFAGCTAALVFSLPADAQGQSRYRRSGTSTNNSSSSSTGTNTNDKKGSVPNSVYKPSNGTTVHNYGSSGTTGNNRPNNYNNGGTTGNNRPNNYNNGGTTGNNRPNNYNNGGTTGNNRPNNYNNGSTTHNYNNGGSSHNYNNRPSRPSAGHTPPPPPNHQPPRPVTRPHGAPVPRPSVHHYGYSTPSLPYGATIIHRGTYDYYYISGRFYRPYNGAYVICRPPVGAIIAANFLSGTIYLTNYVIRDMYGNIRQRYYTDDDGVYYVKSGRNYIVVDPPVGAVVYELPFGYEEIFVNGVKYYRVDDNFYEMVYEGGNNYYFRMIGTLGR